MTADMNMVTAMKMARNTRFTYTCESLKILIFFMTPVVFSYKVATPIEY